MPDSILSPTFQELRRLEALRLMLDGVPADDVAQTIGATAADVQAWFDGQTTSQGSPGAPASVRETKRIRLDQKRLLAPFLEAMEASVGITPSGLRYLGNWLLGVTFTQSVGETALREMGYLPSGEHLQRLGEPSLEVGEALWVKSARQLQGRPLSATDKRVELARRMKELIEPVLPDGFEEELLALAGGSAPVVAEEFMRSVCQALLMQLRERAPSSLRQAAANARAAADAVLSPATK